MTGRFIGGGRNYLYNKRVIGGVLLVIDHAEKGAAKTKCRGGGFLSLGAGFTFIELVTVIVILSALMVSAYPLLSRNNGLGLDAAAKLVKADIYFTQRRAMLDGSSLSIMFTQGSSAYIYGVAGGGAASYSRNLAEIDSSVFIGSTITFTFNSLGEPVSITEDTPVLVSRPDESVSLIVTSYTGKIVNP